LNFNPQSLYHLPMMTETKQVGRARTPLRAVPSFYFLAARSGARALPSRIAPIINQNWY
jgi:hypothetical protein